MPKSSIKTKKPSWKRAALAIGAIGIIAGSLTVTKRAIDPTEKVIEVIDGDTFKISNTETIRLFNTDAPELGRCFGEEAKTALTKKILGKRVILKSPKTDYYRRVQAYVYLDGEFINEYMTKNGFALDRGSGGEESERIVTSGNFAKENKIGIYSEECSPTKPTKKGCLIKAQIPYDNGQKIYLVPGCKNYTQAIVEKFRGEDWYCTEKEVKEAGYIKSEFCP